MILINDKLVSREEVTVDIEDRGYQFGDGIYEVVRFYNGKPFKLDEHLIRLERSAKEIRLSLPFPIEVVKMKTIELAEKNSLNNGIIYMQITRGIAPRNHAFPQEAKSILTAYTKEIKDNKQDSLVGIKVITVDDIRWLRCDIKSINLLGNVLAKQQAIENGAKEAIQIRNGSITEGSSSNFFIIKDGKIYTHPANNLILRGITRDVIESIAKAKAIPFVEGEFSLEDVYNADEAFVASTTFEITPVIQINNIKLSDEIGPITKVLLEEFNRIVNQ